MPLITLGNLAPVEAEPGLYHTHRIGGQVEHHHSYGEISPAGRRRASHDDVTVTRVLNPLLSHTTTLDVPDDRTVEQLVGEVEHLWPHHSTEAPGFVLCDDRDVQRAVENLFGLKAPKGPTALLLNTGRDWLSQQTFGTAVAAATNQGKYIGVTANSAAAAAADMSLPGEITTASGGLIRTAGVVAHTTAASTTTVTVTLTANGNDTLPVTLAKAWLAKGVTPTAGDGLFETLLSTTATLSAVGDAVTITWTITHA